MLQIRRILPAALALLAACAAGAPAATAAPRAPRHVVATQGATDARALRVVVTWDRSDTTAAAYRIIRSGVEIGRVDVRGDSWNDAAFVDTTVQAGRSYVYQVRAESADESAGAASRGYRVMVRSDAQIGSGRVFAVDDYAGSDGERARAAVAAASAAGGGVVAFGARTYVLDQPLRIATDAIVLRGEGDDRTFIQPGYEGAADPCATAVPVVSFAGRLRGLPTRPTAAAPLGARTVEVEPAHGVEAGDTIVLNQAAPQMTPEAYERAGVPQDTSSEGDRRHAWEANEVESVTATTVTFAHPLAYALHQDVPWLKIIDGRGGGIERLTLQGPSADTDGYYHLLSLDHVTDFGVADVQARWANRSFVEARGYDIRFVGFKGPDGGRRSFDGAPCKYKISLARAANVVFVDGELGDPSSDENQSFVTIQRAVRVLVRASVFHGSRTYGINEHGGGSREMVFENNRFAVGPAARYGAIDLGGLAWGFSGPVIVRNNAFSGNARDVYVRENSFEVRVLDNVSRANTGGVIVGYGWAGPDTDADHAGSLRMTIKGNRVESASGDGIVLGTPLSPWYPVGGVRDVIIADNELDVAGKAISLLGSEETTRRFQVSGNAGSASYERPPFSPGAYWSGNADDVSYGRPTTVDWSVPYFGWEPGDAGD